MSMGGRRRRRRRTVHVMVFALFAFSCFAMYVFTTALQPRYCFGPTYRLENFLLPGPGGPVTSRVVVLELNDSQVLVVSNSSVLSHGLREQRGTVLMLRGQSPTHREKQVGKATNVAVQLSRKTWHALTKAMKEAETALFPWKPWRVRRVNCRKVFKGNARELAKARRFEQLGKSGAAIPDRLVVPLAANCSSFKRMFGFITSPLTEQERDFPIAYSLLVFKDAGQVLNLLRAIYRPQNYYCIHIDSKSQQDFREAMLAMTACFPNVFLSSRSVDVQWGTFSVLEPELVCMANLWTRGKWKYFINLTGQEFPLRTNLELVQILTAYRGANNLEGTRQRANKERWAWTEPPPGGIVPTKGSVHVVVNRDMVHFILHTTLARDFLSWTRQVEFPDEVFFSSLNHNPHLGIRGTYTGNPETDSTDYPFLTRFKNWGLVRTRFPCAGSHYVRQICILSSGDLPLLATRPELFANKFYAGESRLALDCLAESLFNRTRDQFLGRSDFNVDYYADLPFVKKAVNVSTFERSLV